MAEQLFRLHTKNLISQSDIVNKMTEYIVKKIKEKFEDVPECHLKILMTRWVYIRYQFLATFEGSKAKVKQKNEIMASSNASKSMKAHALLK